MEQQPRQQRNEVAIQQYFQDAAALKLMVYQVYFNINAKQIKYSYLYKQIKNESGKTEEWKY